LKRGRNAEKEIRIKEMGKERKCAKGQRA